MAYPAIMEPAKQKVEESRNWRAENPHPEMDLDTKAKLLEEFHPDFNLSVKRELKIGVSKGSLAPQEIADYLEAPSRLDSASIDLSKPNYETEILVIGSGGGGLSAALSAKEGGAQVLLATKLRMGDSNTIMAEGGINAATRPEDSPAIHYVDTLVGGRGTNIPELVEALVFDAPFILDWLTKLGVNFDRQADGSYFSHRPGGHSRRRSHSVMDLTGLEIMRVLGDEVRNQGISILEFSPAVELLLDENGACAGAVLWDYDTNTYTVVKAQKTILATGGMGRLHPLGFPTSNHYGATADGLIMGYRAGAELLYVESVQYHPTGTAWPEQMLGLLISEALRAQGAQVVNRDGELFAASLETRDALAAAIIRECGARDKGVVTPTGMKGVWLDTPLIDQICGPGTFQHRFAGIRSRFLKHGIDPVDEPILVYPTQHYQNGGLKIDRQGQTTVTNLYGVGEVSGGVHGHNRLGANSLLDIFVFGRRAGEHAAANLNGAGPAGLSLAHVQAYHAELVQAGIRSDLRSPLLLPDYRYEKALTIVRHVDEQG
ncbi:MAG: FAD-binding protein [Desulfarculaceae bacterium]|jgi:succinate dehydrogenase / fumarate reductase flavoprotein subunit